MRRTIVPVSFSFDNSSPFAAVNVAVPAIANGGGVLKLTEAFATNLLCPK